MDLEHIYGIGLDFISKNIFGTGTGLVRYTRSLGFKTVRCS
jgi:hypothetical protein